MNQININVEDSTSFVLGKKNMIHLQVKGEFEVQILTIFIYLFDHWKFHKFTIYWFLSVFLLSLASGFQ